MGNCNEAEPARLGNPLMRNAGKSRRRGLFFIHSVIPGSLAACADAARPCRVYAENLAAADGRYKSRRTFCRSKPGTTNLPLLEPLKWCFFEAQPPLRKHRMPDPAESSHFGRWSVCANEVLKQRAMAKQCENETPRENNLPNPVELILHQYQAKRCAKSCTGQLSTAPGFWGKHKSR